MKASTLFILTLMLNTAATAEYRVFTLHITNADASYVKQVQTTLDPEQYIGFYPLQTGQSISYIETWKCLGRTDGFKPHCDNPRLMAPANPSLDRGPASQSPEVVK